MLSSLSTIILYEIKTTLQQAFNWLTPLLFFILVVCLFPMAIGPDKVLLAKIAPGIIWVAALLAVILSMESLFYRDAQTGYLDLLLLSPYPLTLLIICKLFSHWITHCLPLILLTPLLGLLLGMTPRADMALLITLVLGTPVLILLGAIGAALVIGIRGHGLLLPILIMPLYVPVIIFGTGTVLAAEISYPLTGYFAIMGALLLLSLATTPWLTSIALRTGANQ